MDYGHYESARRNFQNKQVAKTDHHAQSRIDELERRIDYLCLINASLWDLIKQHTDLTEDKLIDRMENLDIQDGKLDGQIKTPPRSCKKCQKKLMQHAQVCQYCQCFNPFETAFEAVW